jgi:hypothetical protein
MFKKFVALLLYIALLGCDNTDDMEIGLGPVSIEGYSTSRLGIESNASVEVTLNLSQGIETVGQVTLDVNSSDSQDITALAFDVDVLSISNREIKLVLSSQGDINFARNIPLEFTLSFSENINDALTIPLGFYSIPDMSQLNWPQRSIFKRDSLKTLLVEENNIDFYWLNLGQWQVPETPTWYENPYSNISWRLFYHSLGWLTTYGEVYKETNDPKYLEAIKSYIIQYNNAFEGTEDSNQDVAYREDAVALRVNHLIYFYLNFFRGEDSKASDALNSLIYKDFIKLQQYIDDPQYHDENHGLIQVKSALNLITALPLDNKSNKLFEAAMHRLNLSPILMFDSEDGLSVEQASDYHYIGISMLIEAKLQLDNLQLTVPQPMLDTISKAIVSGAYLLYDDGTTPAIGDSYSNKYWLGYLKGYYQRFKVELPEFERFLSYGQEALDSLKVFKNEGLIVAKVQHDDSSSKVFFDAGLERIVHGHFDNLNVLAAIEGEKLLIDSGGPFVYSNAGRVNFWSLAAQNTVVVDNIQSYTHPAIIMKATETEDYFLLAGKQKLNDNIEVYRAVIIVKNGDSPVIFVIDDIIPTDGMDHQFNQYWHFPEQSQWTGFGGQHSTIELTTGTTFGNIKLESLGNCALIQGLYDANGIERLGWISDAYNIAKIAPVESCRYVGKQYQQVNVFAKQDTLDEIDLPTKDNGVLSFSIQNSVYSFNRENSTLIKQ